MTTKMENVLRATNVNNTTRNQSTKRLSILDQTIKTINEAQELFLCEDEKTEYPNFGESVQEILIGNSSYDTVEIQTSTTENDKFKVRMYPEGRILRKNRACSFKIFVKPLCTCEIENANYNIVVKNFRTKRIFTYPIKISFKTKKSMWLDYEELNKHKTKVLGEGSFGIVYLGELCGVKIAIKEMKGSGNIVEMG